MRTANRSPSNTNTVARSKAQCVLASRARVEEAHVRFALCGQANQFLEVFSEIERILNCVYFHVLGISQEHRNINV